MLCQHTTRVFFESVLSSPITHTHQITRQAMALTMQIPRLSMIIHHASQVIELHGNETLHKCKRNHGPVSISICAKQAIAVISTFCCKASSYWCTRVCVYWCRIRKSEHENETELPCSSNKVPNRTCFPKRLFFWGRLILAVLARYAFRVADAAFFP